MFKEYLEERTEKRMIQADFGFVIYSYHEKTVYIEDIYVKKEFRQKGSASGLADIVCKEAIGLGCTTLIGSVDPKAKGATTSLKVLLAYGMEVFNCDNLIWFKKELGG